MSQFSAAPNPSISTLLDQTFWLYRRHFARFVLLAMLAQLPLALFQLASYRWSDESVLTIQQLVNRMDTLPPTRAFGQIPQAILTLYIVSTVIAMLYSLGQGAITRAVILLREGHTPTLRSAYRLDGLRLVRLLVVQLPLSLLTFSLAFPLLASGMVIMLTLGLHATSVSGTAGGVILIVAGLASVLLGPALIGLLVARLFLTIPILVLEDISILGSLRRSWRLTAGAFWRSLGISLLTNLIYGLAVYLPSAAILYLFHTAWLTIFVRYMAITLTLPIMGIATTLYYTDRCIHREGLDLGVRIAQLRQLDVTELASQPSATAQPTRVTDAAMRPEDRAQVGR
jgi:hypothetical protein